MKKYLWLIGGGLFWLGWLVGIYTWKIDNNTIKATRVIDGDTIELNTKQKIRLDNITTPEEGRCGWKEAKEELERLVLRKKVRAEGKYVDDYGRLIGLVYTGEKLVNLEMVKSGWAKYNSNKTSARDDIRQIGEKAKENNLGLYGLCRQMENVDKPECSIKGNNRKEHGTRIYTFPGCKSYKNTFVDLDLGDEWFCSEEEAMSVGYTKAEDCFGKNF